MTNENISGYGQMSQLRATELGRGFEINLKEEVGGIYVGKAFPLEVMT